MKKSESLILVAFCNLLLNQELEAITIHDIYTKAGVSRSSFYNYFNSKEDLINSTLSFAFDRLTSILNKNLLFKKPIMTEMLNFIFDHREIYYPLVTAFPNIDTVVTDYITAMITNSEIESLEEQLEKGYQIPNQFALEVYVLTIKGIIFTWIKSDFSEPVETVADIIYKSVAI